MIAFWVSIMLAFAFCAGAAFQDSFMTKDIRKFEHHKYCETKSVAGKEFKRCLQAVEVPDGLAPEAPSGEILE